MPTTINIKPDYKAIHARFKEDAVRTLESFASKGSKTLTRSEVYSFVASLRVALDTITDVSELEQLRYDYAEAANKVFERVQEEY
jgi:hypothetical protein